MDSTVFTASSPYVVGEPPSIDRLEKTHANTVFNNQRLGVRSQTSGMHLRTHPDFDTWASKVMLVRADEVVFDDGYRLATGLDRLVADITASGTGGIDTGSEAASTWYEVYVIRKSSDGTLSMLLHRAKDHTADTAFTTSPDATRQLRLATGTATDKLAQGIQFANAKPFVYTHVQLIRNNGVAGTVWFTLESDSGGSPSGTVLATSDKINANNISTSQQVLQVVFRTPYTVAASTQYHLVMHGDYTKSDTVYIGWRGLVAGGYSNGSAKEYNGSVWSAASGVGDFYFSAHLEFNNAAVVMPGAYDQKCLVGHAYNDSSSDFIAFNALDRCVFYQRRTLSIGSVGATNNLALFGLSARLPNRPVMAQVGFGTSAEAGTGTEMQVLSLSGFFAAQQFFLPIGIGAAAGASTTYDMVTAKVFVEYQALYFAPGGRAGAFNVLGFEW